MDSLQQLVNEFYDYDINAGDWMKIDELKYNIEKKINKLLENPDNIENKKNQWEEVEYYNIEEYNFGIQWRLAVKIIYTNYKVRKIDLEETGYNWEIIEQIDKEIKERKENTYILK
jgi:hypothetical protein